jgi:hypothetical protein
VTLTRLLLLCGVVGGPLFVVAFLALGATRKGYDPMRQPVSALAMGPEGWLQQVNFCLTAALMLAAAYGLHLAGPAHRNSFWAPLLIGLFALGLLGAGIFVTDITGLSSAPERSRRTRPAVLHDLFSFLAFASLIAACFVFAGLFSAAARPGWSAYCGACGVLLILGFVLFARGFSRPGPMASVAGLLQRLTIATGWLWVSSLCANALIG